MAVTRRRSPVAKLTDPERLKCYLNALSNWRYTGYVQLTDFAEREFKRLGLGIELANCNDFLRNSSSAAEKSIRSRKLGRNGATGIIITICG